MNWICIDIETRSRAELADVGQWNYSRDPSTQILCAAVSINGETPTIHDVRYGQTPPGWEQAVAEGWEIWARNVAFEYSVITNASAWPKPGINQWRDSAAVSVVNGFPAGLGPCAKAMRLPEQKDEAGTALINFWSKPINSGHAKGEFRDPDDYPEKWAEFLRYCHQDVATDVAILKALPPLTEHEMKFWLATWRMNVRGIYVDMPLVRGLRALVTKSRDLIGGQLLESTSGLFDASVTSNHKKVLEYVNEHDANLDSVAKPKVREALAREDLTEEARVVLEARQALGKTSVAKLDSLLLETGDDSRLRFLFRPHGAATGRDTSMGFQIQNIPRGGKFPVEKLVKAAREGNEQEFLNLSYEKGKKLFDPLGAVVSCLRGCLAAPEGGQLAQMDWSSVEPRLGAWVVGDDDMLAMFRRIDAHGGPDLYMVEAAKFYNIPPEEVIGDKRQNGKVYVLQNQYQSSERSIQTAAKDQYGLTIDIDTCVQMKDVWRALHPKWVRMWYDLEAGAISATKSPNRVFKVGCAAFCHDGTHLRMRLPSGRKITFPFARVKLTKTPWGAYKDQVHYWYEFKHHWMEGPTHGGALFNAVIQGLGSDLMRQAVIVLDSRNEKVVLRAHDELVLETFGIDSADVLRQVMLTKPEWAPDLPLAGGSWIGPRFKKD